jgi:CrcB protein
MTWAVALGSAAGGVLRYLLGRAVQDMTGGTFPVGTLLINILGSCLLAFLVRYAQAVPALSPALRLGLTSGFCGGFTTFSTFTVETVTLAEAGEYRRAALYVVASLGLSLLGAILGVAAAQALSARSIVE